MNDLREQLASYGAVLESATDTWVAGATDAPLLPGEVTTSRRRAFVRRDRGHGQLVALAVAAVTVVVVVVGVAVIRSSPDGSHSARAPASPPGAGAQEPPPTSMFEATVSNQGVTLGVPDRWSSWTNVNALGEKATMRPLLAIASVPLDDAAAHDAVACDAQLPAWAAEGVGSAGLIAWIVDDSLSTSPSTATTAHVSLTSSDFVAFPCPGHGVGVTYTSHWITASGRLIGVYLVAGPEVTDADWTKLWSAMQSFAISAPRGG